MDKETVGLVSELNQGIEEFNDNLIHVTSSAEQNARDTETSRK